MPTKSIRERMFSWKYWGCHLDIGELVDKKSIFIAIKAGLDTKVYRLQY